MMSIGLGLLFLVLMEFLIPAWQELLGMDNTWLCAIMILLICPLMGLANIPVSIRLSGRTGSVNLLSVLLPITILGYIYPELDINWSWVHLTPIVLSLLLFLSCSYATPKGAHIYPFSFVVGAFGTLFMLHAILGHDIQQFLWFAFASQFIPLLLVDFLRTSQSAKLMMENDKFCLGQGGARASLWVAPSFTLFLSYLAHLYLWNSTHNPIG